MRQFVYISMAMTSDETAIDRIVEESLRNNARDAITGFLLYNGRNFLQLVEGPVAPMLALITRLARDPRHGGILRLEDCMSAERCCPDWAMRRLGFTGSVPRRREMLDALIPADLTSPIRHTIVNFATLN